MCRNTQIVSMMIFIVCFSYIVKKHIKLNSYSRRLHFAGKKSTKFLVNREVEYFDIFKNRKFILNVLLEATIGQKSWTKNKQICTHACSEDTTTEKK